jgi:hypothetical protein
MSKRRIADSPDAADGRPLLGWDPYQVWLTRVQQPREQNARRRSRPTVVEPTSTTDLSETARLRTLSALQR